MSLCDVTKGCDASTGHSHGIVNDLSFSAFRVLRMCIRENCCFFCAGSQVNEKFASCPSIIALPKTKCLIVEALTTTRALRPPG